MRRRYGIISATTAMLCGLALAGTPAQASATTPNGIPAGAEATFHGRPIRDAATAQTLADAYWTPERMRSATPLEPLVGEEELAGEAEDRPGRVGEPRSGAEPIGPRGTGTAVPGASVSARNASAGAGTQSVNPSPGVGRVFFTDANNEDHFCSASAINTAKANLVSTAGHCLHPGDGSDNWYTNWVFAPNYADGPSAWGLWSARSMTSTKGWVNHDILWWDYGFVTVWPRNGKRLVDVTGGEGISFNYPRSVAATLLGYPGAAPFDGRWQHYCQSTTKAAGSQRVKLMNCPLNEGTSGGPFLRAWNNSQGFGHVNSVASYKFSGNMYGPYFDEDVSDLFDYAKAKN